MDVKDFQKNLISQIKIMESYLTRIKEFTEYDFHKIDIDSDTINYFNSLKLKMISAETILKEAVKETDILKTFMKSTFSLINNKKENQNQNSINTNNNNNFKNENIRDYTNKNGKDNMNYDITDLYNDECINKIKNTENYTEEMNPDFSSNVINNNLNSEISKNYFNNLENDNIMNEIDTSLIGYDHFLYQVAKLKVSLINTKITYNS